MVVVILWGGGSGRHHNKNDRVITGNRLNLAQLRKGVARKLVILNSHSHSKKTLFRECVCERICEEDDGLRNNVERNFLL